MNARLQAVVNIQPYKLIISLGNKKTQHIVLGFLSKELGDDLLSHTKSTLSLAQVRFTALFEMGRGGSKPLLSPNITGNVMHGAEFKLSLL